MPRFVAKQVYVGRQEGVDLLRLGKIRGVTQQRLLGEIIEAEIKRAYESGELAPIVEEGKDETCQSIW